MSDFPEQLQQAVADRYVLDREIGRGGMAIVYHARDLKHDRAVAVKVLRPELGALLGAERFLREIKLVASLQHPHILPLYDSGEAHGALYYVMPYVVGDSLRDRLRREHRVALPDALRIAREVADGLYYAHANGIVHRDIKPENILLSNGHAVVSDFGIARAIHAAGGGKWSTLTGSGVALGTPAYMSPEQTVGESEVDGRSDIYSLGCVLYEMLTGTAPFTAPDGEFMMAWRFTRPPPALRDTVPEVPVTVEQAVTRALAREPTDRFANAREFTEALWAERTTAQRPAQPPVPVSGARPRRRVWLALGGVGAIAAIAAVWFAFAASKSRGGAVVSATPPGMQTAGPRAAAESVALARRAAEEARRPVASPNDDTASRRVTRASPTSPRKPASKSVTAGRAVERQPVAVAPRGDSVVQSLRTGALRVRRRGEEGGATPSELAAGDLLRDAAEAAAREGRLSDAVERFSGAASAWAEAERIARANAARDTQARRIAAPTPKPAAESVPAEPRAEDPGPAIQAVIDRYERAIESGNVAAIRQVYPAITAAQQKDWEKFFGAARDITVSFDIAPLEVAGDAAEARGSMVSRYFNRSTRRPHGETVSFRASLRRDASGWRITSVR